MAIADYAFPEIKSGRGYTHHCLKPGIDLDQVDPALTARENFNINKLQKLYEHLPAIGELGWSCIVPKS